MGMQEISDLFDDLLYLRLRRAVGDTDRYLDPSDTAAREVLYRRVGDDLVGDSDKGLLKSAYLGGAHANILYDPLDTVYLDPLSDTDRLVCEDSKGAKKVGSSILGSQGKGETT